MVRIGTVGRVAVAPVVPACDARAGAGATAGPVESAGRALVAIEGGRREAPRSPGRAGLGRPGAGFVAQLLVAADPSLRPSRLERTRAAAACYAEAARRLA